MFVQNLCFLKCRGRATLTASDLLRETLHSLLPSVRPSQDCRCFKAFRFLFLPSTWCNFKCFEVTSIVVNNAGHITGANNNLPGNSCNFRDLPTETATPSRFYQRRSTLTAHSTNNSVRVEFDPQCTLFRVPTVFFAILVTGPPENVYHFSQ